MNTTKMPPWGTIQAEDHRQATNPGGNIVNWRVYMLLCSDDSLYTGITTDIDRRMAQHQNGSGAKYFRGRNVQRLVYLEGGHDRSSASRREVEIKRLHVTDKRKLIALALAFSACGSEKP